MQKINKNIVEKCRICYTKHVKNCICYQNQTSIRDDVKCNKLCMHELRLYYETNESRCVLVYFSFTKNSPFIKLYNNKIEIEQTLFIPRRSLLYFNVF